MARLTISDAARACNVARTTLQRAVKAGRLSLDAEHSLDTAELLRAGYQVDPAVLYAPTQQDAAPPRSTQVQHGTQQTQQDAAPPRSTQVQQSSAAAEMSLLRKERDMLEAERDRLAQQVELLLHLHQTTQQHLTHEQQLLHAMQQRYDRLLDAPRVEAPRVGGPEARPPRRAVQPRRHEVLAWMRANPGPHRRDEIEGAIGGTLRHTLRHMLAGGLLVRVAPGVYALPESF